MYDMYGHSQWSELISLSSSVMDNTVAIGDGGGVKGWEDEIVVEVDWLNRVKHFAALHVH